MNNTRILLNLALPLLIKCYSAKGWTLLPQDDGMALRDMIRLSASDVTLQFKNGEKTAWVQLCLENARTDISDIVIEYGDGNDGIDAMFDFERQLKELEGQ